MKKTIVLMITVLAVVFVTLSIVGSGGEYAAEKIFFRAMKANSKIVANPDVVPPVLFSSVEKNLRKIIDRYPKTEMAKTAHMALAEFYAAHKEYDKAETVAANIMNIYQKESDIVSAAQFLRGVIYEKQGKWSEALTEFVSLRDKYPHTQFGIQVPLYIARHYDLYGNEERAKGAYEEAQGYYAKMERENRGKSLGYIAANMQTRAFLSAKDYERAGENVRSVIDKYPSGMTFAQMLPLVDIIYIEKLNRPNEALNIYKDVRSKMRDQKIIKFIDKKIKKLETLKK